MQPIAVEKILDHFQKFRGIEVSYNANLLELESLRQKIATLEDASTVHDFTSVLGFFPQTCLCSVNGLKEKLASLESDLETYQHDKGLAELAEESHQQQLGKINELEDEIARLQQEMARLEDALRDANQDASVQLDKAYEEWQKREAKISEEWKQSSDEGARDKRLLQEARALCEAHSNRIRELETRCENDVHRGEEIEILQSQLFDAHKELDLERAKTLDCQRELAHAVADRDEYKEQLHQLQANQASASSLQQQQETTQAEASQQTKASKDRKRKVNFRCLESDLI